MSDMRLGPSLEISRAFVTDRHPALLSKLSAYGIQCQLYKWLADFLYSHSEHLALNGILSSPLRAKAVFWASPFPDFHQ